MQTSWLVYVRWQTGKRETIRTTTPETILQSSDACVLACMPVPRIVYRPVR
jgi:hypothetical protein